MRVWLQALAVNCTSCRVAKGLCACEAAGITHITNRRIIVNNDNMIVVVNIITTTTTTTTTITTTIIIIIIIITVTRVQPGRASELTRHMTSLLVRIDVLTSAPLSLI